jgi:iron-sulfur cluster repair protein YtfE (RIC family)
MAQDQGAATPPGEHLVSELKWVHTHLRRDLRTIRNLAAQVRSGARAAVVAEAVRTLQVQSPLWQLRVNCLRYCQLVLGHHGGEDVLLFPALRKADRAMGPVVDRLESDHRRISDLLDEVAALAELLGSNAGAETRERLVAALESLGPQLLEHLAFEEEAISPTLRQWARWPF